MTGAAAEAATETAAGLRCGADGDATRPDVSADAARRKVKSICIRGLLRLLLFPVEQRKHSRITE